MKLIVVRHGETKENAKRILMGHLPGTLSKRGIAQARTIMNRLKDTKIHKIYSSDLKRAVSTTKAIAKYHKIPIKYSKALREQNYGVFQGRPHKEFFAAQGISKSFKPRGGESLNDLKCRVSHFITKLRKNRSLDSKTILISTHAGVVWSMMSIFTRIPIHKVIKMRPRNTGILIFEVNRKESRLLKDDMFVRNKQA